MSMTPLTRKAVFEEVSGILGKHHLFHTEVIEILAMALVSVIKQQPQHVVSHITSHDVMNELNDRVQTILHEIHDHEMQRLQ